MNTQEFYDKIVYYTKNFITMPNNLKFGDYEVYSNWLNQQGYIIDNKRKDDDDYNLTLKIPTRPSEAYRTYEFNEYPIVRCWVDCYDVEQQWEFTKWKYNKETHLIEYVDDIHLDAYDIEEDEVTIDEIKNIINDSITQFNPIKKLVNINNNLSKIEKDFI